MSEWQFVLAFWSLSGFALLTVWCVVDWVYEIRDNHRFRREFAGLLEHDRLKELG